MSERNQTFGALDGFGCSPTCRSTSCTRYKKRSSCDRVENKFEIINPVNMNATKIVSGDIVALRSKRNPSQWLHCSSDGSSCKISRCIRNGAREGPITVTTCDYHFFRIYAIRRPDGTPITTTNRIQLRHLHNNNYFFNCNAQSKCKVSSCSVCLIPRYILRFKIIQDN